jgi:hypothetical protein
VDHRRRARRTADLRGEQRLQAVRAAVIDRRRVPVLDDRRPLVPGQQRQARQSPPRLRRTAGQQHLPVPEQPRHRVDIGLTRPHRRDQLHAPRLGLERQLERVHRPGRDIDRPPADPPRPAAKAHGRRRQLRGRHRGRIGAASPDLGDRLAGPHDHRVKTVAGLHLHAEQDRLGHRPHRRLGRGGDRHLRGDQQRRLPGIAMEQRDQPRQRHHLRLGRDARGPASDHRQERLVGRPHDARPALAGAARRRLSEQRQAHRRDRQMLTPPRHRGLVGVRRPACDLQVRPRRRQRLAVRTRELLQLVQHQRHRAIRVGQQRVQDHDDQLSPVRAADPGDPPRWFRTRVEPLLRELGGEPQDPRLRSILRRELDDHGLAAVEHDRHEHPVLRPKHRAQRLVPLAEAPRRLAEPRLVDLLRPPHAAAAVHRRHRHLEPPPDGRCCRDSLVHADLRPSGRFAPPRCGTERHWRETATIPGRGDMSTPQDVCVDLAGE